MIIAAVAYWIVVAVMSLVCFLAYGLDKQKAAKGGRRLSERALHLMAFLGGWPGALLGQRHFRHKTQKVSFRLVFWMVVVCHVVIVGVVTYALLTLDKQKIADQPMAPPDKFHRTQERRPFPPGNFQQFLRPFSEVVGAWPTCLPMEHVPEKGAGARTIVPPSEGMGRSLLVGNANEE